jgi:hypothetical protein
MYPKTYPDVLNLARVDEMTDFAFRQTDTHRELLRRL